MNRSSATQTMPSRLIAHAIASLRAGRKSVGRRLLEEVVQTDPCSDQGWLWLSEAVDTEEERRFCMNQVLAINRHNTTARRGIEALGPGPVQSPLWVSAAGIVTLQPKVTPRCSDKDGVWFDHHSEQVEPRLAEGQNSSLALARSNKHNKTSTWQEFESPGQTGAPSPANRQDMLPEIHRKPRLNVIDRLNGDQQSAISSPLLLIALGYLVALVVAEELTSLFDPRVGLAVYGGLMAGLILHTALIWRRPFYKLFLSLTVIPLVRILSLSLSLASFPLVYWYLIVSIPLFMAVFLITRTVGFSWKQIGLDLKKLPIQGLTAFTGLAFGYVKYQLLRPEPLVQTLTWEQLWLPVLILLVCTGFAEELLFRGVMQRAATEAMGSLGGFYVAALFAVMRVGHRSWLDIPFAFGMALFFSWVVTKTHSLLGVTLAHGLTNIALFLVFPLLPAVNGG